MYIPLDVVSPRRRLISRRVNIEAGQQGQRLSIPLPLVLDVHQRDDLYLGHDWFSLYRANVVRFQTSSRGIDSLWAIALCARYDEKSLTDCGSIFTLYTTNLEIKWTVGLSSSKSEGRSIQNT